MIGLAKFSLFCSVALATACTSVTTSGINQIGPDTYTISVRAGRASGGMIGAEGIALQKAGGYCRRASQEILVLISGEVRNACQAKFRGLPAGDPDLRRLPIETVPDRIIEQRQR